MKTTNQTAEQVAKILGRKDETCNAVVKAMSYGTVIGCVSGTGKYLGERKMQSVRKVFPNAKRLVVVAYGRNQGNDTIAVY